MYMYIYLVIYMYVILAHVISRGGGATRTVRSHFFFDICIWSHIYVYTYIHTHIHTFINIYISYVSTIILAHFISHGGGATHTVRE